jgi:hypothetical protein
MREYRDKSQLIDVELRKVTRSRASSALCS